MQTVNKCPKCNFSSYGGFNECPSCGIIVSKFLKREKKDKEFEKGDAGSLAEARMLKIKQQKEWGEILTGFETVNRYQITDSWGNQILRADEESGSFFTKIVRMYLKALRPFEMYISSPDSVWLYILSRPFRFWFHEVTISRADGNLMGTVKRQFSIFRRIYTVTDRTGRETFKLFGPILHPWTFQIKRGDMELGKITKKWSGLAKEAFTDADNFAINFPKGIDINQKAILLGAVFLVDFVHFENRGK